MHRTTAVVWALLSILALPGIAQQPRQPAPRFRTGIELVLLDVSVLDANRMPVRGLDDADFTVLEDGRPQPIQTFKAVDLPDVVTAFRSPGRWVREIAPDVRRNTEFEESQVVVIALDDATPMRAAEVPQVRVLAHRVIEQLGPTDMAAVVFALDKKSGQDFTRDRVLLRAAVDRFNGANDITAFDGFDSAALTLYQAAVGSVKGVCEYLSELPERRKALVWVSVGVPIDWELAQPAMISLNQPGAASVESAVNAVIKSARDALAAAQRANVSIYGMSPGGLRAPVANYSALSGTTKLELNPGKLNQEFLRGISDSSGGFAVVDTNDPAPGITQVLRENRSYYLLGYAPANERAQGRFRKVEVRVNRPGVTVRARRGYFERDERMNAKTTATPSPLNAALGGIVPKTDLMMQVSAAPFAVPGRREAAVAIVLGLNQPAPARATRVVQRIDFEAAAFTADGRRRAARREHVQATLNTPGIAKTVGYETFARLELPPGRYYLRIAAESRLEGIRVAPSAPAVALLEPGDNRRSRSGSVYYDLEVPDFAKAAVSLSGVLLSVSPAVVSGPKERLAALVPVVPTSLREFTATDIVTAFVRVYRGDVPQAAGVTVRSRIADANGAIVADQEETYDAARFDKAGAADHVVEVPVARLKPGPHLLTIEASLREKVARRDVRFEVK